MRGRKVGILLIAVLAVVFVAGCAKAPQAELESAKAALESARAAGADRYVPDVFKAAQDSLNAATTEIEAQNSKFAPTRNYKKALPLLDAASRLAAEAEAQVAGKKEEVKAEAQKLAGEAKAALDEAKRLVRRAPRGKEGRAAIEAIQGELNAVEASLAEVPAMIEKEDFANARDRAKAALAKTKSIIEELKQAIAKKS
ncbi:MAG TPA: DUF4398 domain-containing protein [bacterium]|nr:DUF4398 domain-containing protein [bacterium]